MESVNIHRRRGEELAAQHLGRLARPAAKPQGPIAEALLGLLAEEGSEAAGARLAAAVGSDAAHATLVLEGYQAALRAASQPVPEAPAPSIAA